MSEFKRGETPWNGGEVLGDAASRTESMQHLMTDGRWTYRLLRRNPLFATAVIATLILAEPSE